MPSTPTPDPFDPIPMSDSLRTLARRGELRRLRKGVQLITEGDRGDTLFIVLAGQLRAYSVGADGREVTAKPSCTFDETYACFCRWTGQSDDRHRIVTTKISD